MKVIRWIMINTIFAYGLYVAQSINWVEDIMISLIILMALLTIIGSTHVDIRNSFRNSHAKNKSVPDFIDISYDVFFVTALIYYQWYFVAFLYTSTMALNYSIIHTPVEPSEKDNA